MERYVLDKLNNGKYTVVDNTPFPTVIEVHEDFKDAKEILDLYNQFANNQTVRKYKLDLGYAFTYCYFSTDLEARDWFFRYFRQLDYIGELTEETKITRDDDGRLIAFLKYKKSSQLDRKEEQ